MLTCFKNLMGPDIIGSQCSFLMCSEIFQFLKISDFWKFSFFFKIWFLKKPENKYFDYFSENHSADFTPPWTVPARSEWSNKILRYFRLSPRGQNDHTSWWTVPDNVLQSQCHVEPAPPRICVMVMGKKALYNLFSVSIWLLPSVPLRGHHESTH